MNQISTLLKEIQHRPGVSIQAVLMPGQGIRTRIIHSLGRSQLELRRRDTAEQAIAAGIRHYHQMKVRRIQRMKSDLPNQRIGRLNVRQQKAMGIA